MQAKPNQFRISLIVLAVWIAIIIIGPMVQLEGRSSLEDLVSHQVVLSLILAPLFLVAAVVYLRWQRAVGLNAAQPARSWLTLWLPALFILCLLGFGLLLGLPPTQVIIVVLINTLLVGVSEELMFRGIVFQGALSRFKIWPAIWITAVLFGSVHALNGFMTGDFGAALAQTLQATLSGIWLQAIRLRTKSLYPAMLIHGLWDFALFILGNAVAASLTERSLDAAEPSLAQQFAVAIVAALPLFLYGLWLLRGIGQKSKAELLA
jgi:membrane protease YdiL (CAAX protease family)